MTVVSSNMTVVNSTRWRSVQHSEVKTDRHRPADAELAVVGGSLLVQQLGFTVVGCAAPLQLL